MTEKNCEFCGNSYKSGSLNNHLNRCIAKKAYDFKRIENECADKVRLHEKEVDMLNDRMNNLLAEVSEYKKANNTLKNELNATTRELNAYKQFHGTLVEMSKVVQQVGERPGAV